MKFYDRLKERRNKKKVEKEIKKLQKLRFKREAEEEKEKRKEEIEKLKQETKEEPIKTPPHIETSKERTLIERLGDIETKITELTEPKKDKVKKKMLKVPPKVKRQLKKLAIKNKIIALILRENRSAEMRVLKVNRGFIFLDSVPHQSSLDFTFLFNGKYPMIVIKEWDLAPVGTKDYYEAKEKGERNAYSAAELIRMLEEKELLKSGSKMELKHWIWVGIAGLVLGYLILGG